MSTERMNVRFDSPTRKVLYQDCKQGGTGTVGVRAGADSWITTVAASQTNADAIFPLPGLEVGDKIIGYHLVGQVESGGNSVSIVGLITAMSAAVADVTQATVPGSSKTVSASADKALTEATTKHTLVPPVVIADNKTYALHLTITTAASTDVALLGVCLHVQPRV